MIWPLPRVIKNKRVRILQEPMRKKRILRTLKGCGVIFVQQECFCLSLIFVLWLYEHVHTQLTAHIVEKMKMEKVSLYINYST